MTAIAIAAIAERVDQLTSRFEGPAQTSEQPQGLFQAELARLTQQQIAARTLDAGADGGIGAPGRGSGFNPAGLGALAGWAGGFGTGLNGLGSTGGYGTTFGAGAAGGYGTAPSAAAGTVISSAMAELGVPYLWGGTSSAGWDCSGLVQHAYRTAGVEMPRVSRDQARMGVEVPGLDLAKPGDLIAFGSPVDHIGIYLGDGKMLHAPKRGDVVKVSGISRPIATIRRIITPGAVAVGPAGPGPSGSTGSPTSVGSPAEYRGLFQQAGAAHGVDPGLLAAVAKVESGFNPSAVSPAGAKGLMQFMPATASQFGVDPLDPASAVDGAARYLRRLIDELGSVELALAGYNAGPGNVRKYGGIPPFAETQQYVSKVLDAWRSNS